jgi:hypothetical protein
MVRIVRLEKWRPDEMPFEKDCATQAVDLGGAENLETIGPTHLAAQGTFRKAVGLRSERSHELGSAEQQVMERAYALGFIHNSGNQWLDGLGRPLPNPAVDSLFSKERMGSSKTARRRHCVAIRSSKGSAGQGEQPRPAQ